MSWIIAACIALFTAFSFAEVVTCNKNKKLTNAGLGEWANQLCGYNLGRGVKIWQPCFYYIIKVFAMGMFAAAAMYEIVFSLNSESDWFQHNTMIVVMFSGLILIALFIFLTYFPQKFGQGFSKFTTIVKFIPFAAIILISLIFGIISANGGLWTGHYEYVDGASGKFSITGIFESIPAILFAFDSFLVIGNVAKDVKDSKKNVSLAVVISMIIAASLELLITISEITIGTGDPYKVFYIVFGDGTLYKISVAILSMFILIAALGVLNSLTIAGIYTMQSSINHEILFGSRRIKQFRANNPIIHGVIYFSCFIFAFFLAISIPSMILNTEQIFDGISNLAILFFFAIYATVVLFTFINRFTKKVEVNKFFLFYPSAIISIIGCYFAFGYCAFYQFFIEVIKSPTGTSSNSWGLAFLANARSTSLINWQCAAVFWAAAICFIGLPFLNDLLIKLTNKNYQHPLIWQKFKQKTTYKINNN